MLLLRLLLLRLLRLLLPPPCARPPKTALLMLLPWLWNAPTRLPGPPTHAQAPTVRGLSSSTTAERVRDQAGSPDGLASRRKPRARSDAAIPEWPRFIDTSYIIIWLQSATTTKVSLGRGALSLCCMFGAPGGAWGAPGGAWAPGSTGTQQQSNGDSGARPGLPSLSVLQLSVLVFAQLMTVSAQVGATTYGGSRSQWGSRRAP